MADEKTMTRAEFEAELVKRAWADPAFKKKLLTNPREAIEEELRKTRPDAKLPDTAQYYVHEETPNSLHITLPMNPAELKGSIEDAQGGIGLVPGIVITTIASLTNVTNQAQISSLAVNIAVMSPGAVSVTATVATAIQ